MTRTVSSNVEFDCNYFGCNTKAVTPGPLPDGWADLTVNEITVPAVLDEDTQEIITPEERANKNYHLCPDHVPKLGP